MTPQTIKTGLLVFGSGRTGLRAAIEAKKQGVKVLLLSKSQTVLTDHTALPGNRIAAGNGWRAAEDLPDLHFRETIIAGRSVGNQGLVELMTREIFGLLKTTIWNKASIIRNGA